MKLEETQTLDECNENKILKEEISTKNSTLQKLK